MICVMKVGVDRTSYLFGLALRVVRRFCSNKAVELLLGLVICLLPRFTHRHRMLCVTVRSTCPLGDGLTSLVPSSASSACFGTLFYYVVFQTEMRTFGLHLLAFVFMESFFSDANFGFPNCGSVILSTNCFHLNCCVTD